MRKRKHRDTITNTMMIDKDKKGKEKDTHHGDVLISPILLPKSNLIKSSIW